ncbi:hypothetical protein Tco_0788811 [Tanacetum coccineum]
MVVVKLIGYHHVASDDGSVKEYSDACDIFPLRMGEGLVWKTLQTSDTLLCRNIGDLSDDGLLALLLRSNYKCSCLTICLRSISRQIQEKRIEKKREEKNDLRGFTLIEEDNRRKGTYLNRNQRIATEKPWKNQHQASRNKKIEAA